MFSPRNNKPIRWPGKDDSRPCPAALVQAEAGSRLDWIRKMIMNAGPAETDSFAPELRDYVRRTRLADYGGCTD